MKFSIFVILLCSMSFACDSNKAVTQTPTYQSLFNGENLDGWQIYGTEKWYVEDGLLVCESGPDAGYGYLGTNQKFKNFELLVDFQQEANGNSGIFIRSSVEGTKITNR